ncbi:MAG TPA: hypothetical protein VLA72_14835 [Anaerolineales bacterium]|nr:hypothetical protein [Anaerolineales bacterium]
MKKMEFENRLNSIASGMDYPPTPDVAGSVISRLQDVKGHQRFTSRRLAWSLAIIFVLVSSLILIPPARAAIIEFIQIGIVRIFPQPAEPPETLVPSTATPNVQLPSLIPLLDNIAGKTELVTAQNVALYPLRIPTYPSDLGLPDYVYVQDVEGAMTVLVWIDPHQPENVMLSLHIIPAGHWAVRKFEPSVTQETKVNGQRAVWTEGPYPLFLRNGDIEVMRLIEGHVLIWEDGDITYRLETDQSLEEAIKIAESLEPHR